MRERERKRNWGEDEHVEQLIWQKLLNFSNDKNEEREEKFLKERERISIKMFPYIKEEVPLQSLSLIFSSFSLSLPNFANPYSTHFKYIPQNEF